MPPELEVLKHIKDEPLALVVAVIMIFFRPAEALIRLAIRHFAKNKKKSVEEILQDDAQERQTRQREYDEKFEKIESRLDNLFSIIADHEEFANTLSQGTLENMLFNDGAPIFRRLKSFLRLIAMGVNGRIKKRGMDLILENKEVWLDVLETMPKMNLKIVNQEYFNSVLDEIKHRLFDGMM